MENPTNKLTEEQIRKLVCESDNSLNPLNMVFTYRYVTNLVTVNWIDLYFAIKNNFLTHQTAIEHAIAEIQKNKDTSPEVIELACMLQSEAKFSDDICPIVKKLATSQRINTSESREKFLYVTLNWVYEHRDDYCNLIEVVDILCDDINYPDEVQKLLSFMPTPKPEMEKFVSTRECLFERLVIYLENQRKRWA